MSENRVEVLIETYWNVKMKSKGKDREIFRVLIETYWNVKKPDDPKLDPDPSINRNILECKERSCVRL